jgi:hypothetical protein
MSTKTITFAGRYVSIQTRNVPVFKKVSGFLRERVGTRREVTASFPGYLWHVEAASVREAVAMLKQEISA